MKVAAHIREFLVEGKNCVVPGFGTFTCSSLPAALDREGKNMLPPRKQIQFDYQPQTVNDDFVAYLAGKENLPLAEVRAGLSEFIDDCTFQIDTGKMIKLLGIGTFHKDQEARVIYVPEESLLQSGDFFGLEKITLKKRKKGKRWLTLLLVAFLVCCLAGVGYWGMMLYHMMKDEKPANTVAPAVSAPVRVIPPSNVAKPDTSTEAVTPTTPPQARTTAPAAETKKPEPTVKTTEKSQPEIAPGAARFYIVAGCFKSEDGAKRLVKELKDKGFHAELFGKTSGGLNMVSYNVYPSKAEAEKAILKIKQEENKGAYIVER